MFGRSARKNRYPGIGNEGFVLLTVLAAPSASTPVARDLESFLRFVHSVPYFMSRQPTPSQLTMPPHLQVHPDGGFEVTWPYSVFGFETLRDYMRMMHEGQAWVLAWHDPSAPHVHVEVGVADQSGWARISCPVRDWVLARSEPGRFQERDLCAPYSDLVAGVARRSHTHAQIVEWADLVDSNAVQIMVKNGLDEAARFLQNH